MTRSGSEGSVHVDGDKVVEGRTANTEDSGQLKVRRAPVYLGGAPAGAKYLPHPKLYRTGESFLCQSHNDQKISLLIAIWISVIIMFQLTLRHSIHGVAMY